MSILDGGFPRLLRFISQLDMAHIVRMAGGMMTDIRPPQLRSLPLDFEGTIGVYENRQPFFHQITPGTVAKEVG